MKASFFYIIAALILLTSCSPRIGTILTKTYPALKSNEPVEVFTDTRSVPSDSESLGIVRATDTGFSTQCDSITVVESLKAEARKAGGNAIVITEHIRPSFFGSNCHQMTGTILRIYDFESKTFAENADSIRLEEIESIQPARILPRMDISAGIGYAWRTAKLAPNLDPITREYAKGLMDGFAWKMTFNYYFNDLFGIGLDYSAFRATNKALGQQDGNPGYLKTNDMITFIGPSFSTRSQLNEKWMLNCSLSIGYIGYTSKETAFGTSEKISGASVGMQAGIDIQYKLTPDWGIVFNCNAISGVLSEYTHEWNGYKETIKLDDNSKEGLQHINLLVGVRYYIK
jgi:hypothetical protein